MSARNPTYPGVYVLELPSDVRTIVGVSTSITAFIGRAKKGPVDQPTKVNGYVDFDRQFGGLDKKSNMSYSVFQFFQNGGKEAYIIRVHNNATDSTINAGALTIRASNPGQWSEKLGVEIELQDVANIQDLVTAEQKIQPLNINTLFDLTVRQKFGPNPQDFEVLESFRNLSMKLESDRFVTRVLEEQSDFVRIPNPITPPAQPTAGTFYVENNGTPGDDGNDLTPTNIIGSQTPTGNPPRKTGMYSLDNVDLFNILCIPPYPSANDSTPDPMYTTIYSQAIPYCEDRRAIVLIDPTYDWNKPSDPVSGIDTPNYRNLRHKNAAIFFPHIMAADPLDQNKIRKFVPSGAIAGIMARTDSERGVWKSPAGIEAIIRGITNLTVQMTDLENGALNPLGINCIRIFSPAGIVVWGSRTLKGDDRLADQWKYLAVRRTALYIEESLYRGTQWVVFEPNDEPLWAQIRLNVTAFMHDLFRKGAFQGSSPRDAYLVKCDSETTTQYDIDRGIVNIIVGFAPLKPAEFVILQIKQLTKRSE
jgi:phage tail sheath protein FI